jgi:phosphoribosyl 1,2-cyclic phosphodiesterase
VRYGGNTSCVAVRSIGGTLIVLDMGTGAFALGRELAASGHPVRGHVLISHTHWDHIQGLPFFAPLFRPGNEWDIYAPRGLGPSLREGRWCSEVGGGGATG